VYRPPAVSSVANFTELLKRCSASVQTLSIYKDYFRAIEVGARSTEQGGNG
jgi:hypothetical protein